MALMSNSKYYDLSKQIKKICIDFMMDDRNGFLINLRLNKFDERKLNAVNRLNGNIDKRDCCF